MIIKVVILLLVLGRMSVVAKTKVIKCQEYLFHLAIGTGDGFTSLDGNKRTTFCGKKKYNHDAVFRAVYQLMNDGQQRKPGNHQFPLLLITCRGFLNRSSGAGVGVGKGCSREFLVGVCRPVLQILTPFQTKKKCHFPHPFSDQAPVVQTLSCA